MERAEEAGSSYMLCAPVLEETVIGAGLVESQYWVAVKELSLRYYNVEAISTTMNTRFGNLN